MPAQTTGLTDAQVLGDPADRPDPQAAAAQQPVVWADTGLPVADAALVAQARANGAVAGPVGSSTNPMYMREAETPPAGATYIDAHGTHVAPGTFQAPSSTAAPLQPPAAHSVGATGLTDDQVLGDPDDRATVDAQPAPAATDDPWVAAIDAAKARAGIPDMPSQGGFLGGARAVGSGVLRAIGGAGDLAQSFGEMQTGQSDLSRRLTSLITGQPMEPRPVPKISDVTNAAGGNYQPFDAPQRYEQTGGEFLGNAALGEGGLLRKAAQVVIPTLASQGASDAAGELGLGPTGQNIARFVGGLGGGYVSGLGSAPIPMLPRAEQGTADAVNAALKIGGTDPTAFQASLDANRLPMASDPGLAALGEHVAQTPGPGRAAVRSTAQAQMADEGHRVMAAVNTHLGVDPLAAKGNVDGIVQAGQDAVKPGWDALRADQTPVWNSKLEALSKRPPIAAAIKDAIWQAHANGEDPHALGLTFMDSPGGNAWDAPGMPGETPAAPPSGLVTKAPRLAPAGSQGPSLIKWMADGGGINDEGGEVSNMDGNLWHEGKPFQRKLVNEDGLSPDRWAEKAQDAGYLPAGPTPGPRDLFDAMGRELRGRPIYANGGAAKGPSAGAISDEQAYHAANYAPDSEGPDAYSGAPMPQSEPVPMVQPTAATWDTVRRNMKDQVQRDDTTGRVLPNGRNIAVANATQHLTSALAGNADGTGAAIPGLRDLLNTSSDYMGVRSAYDRAAGTLFSGPVSDFNDLWGSLKTEPERQGVRAGLANDILDKSNRGLLKGGSFKTDGVQQKLQTAFGDKALPFIDQMEREAEERDRLGGMTSGSKTAYNLALDQHFTPPKKFGAKDALQWGGAGIAAMAGHVEPLIVKSMLAMEHAVRPTGAKPWADAATNARLGEVLSSAPKMKALLEGAAQSQAARTAAAQARVRQLQLAPMLAAASIAGATASPAQSQ